MTSSWLATQEVFQSQHPNSLSSITTRKYPNTGATFLVYQFCLIQICRTYCNRYAFTQKNTWCIPFDAHVLILHPTNQLVAKTFPKRGIMLCCNFNYYGNIRLEIKALRLVSCHAPIFHSIHVYKSKSRVPWRNMAVNMLKLYFSWHRC